MIELTVDGLSLWRPPVWLFLGRSGPQWRGLTTWVSIGVTEREDTRRPRAFGLDLDLRVRPFSVMGMLRAGPLQISAAPSYCYIGNRELTWIRHLWSRPHALRS